MDNIKYVYSNGCSFAEGCGLDNPKKERYSKLIADKFGAEDINQSSGGGSNQRIFRTTFEWISENQDKLKNTLFVIQLTYPIRNEIWVNGEHIIKERQLDQVEWSGGWIHSGHGDDGRWVTSKFGHKIQVDSTVREKVNFNYVPHNKECSEITWRYALGLQSYFKSNNIKYIFFDGGINRLDKTCKIAELVDFIYMTPTYLELSRKFYQGVIQDKMTKCNHPNEEVQIEWADKLYSFYQDRYK